MIFNFESCLGIPIPHPQPLLSSANIYVYQRTVLIIPWPHPEMTSVSCSYFLLLKRTSGPSSNFFFNLRESPSPVLHISRLSVLTSFSLEKIESDSKVDLVLATYT
jgi:hypothetical protein